MAELTTVAPSSNFLSLDTDQERPSPPHPRVPPLKYLPAGSMSSKQSSLEVEDPPLQSDLSQAENSRESFFHSISEDGNIIVFEKFTPKDSFSLSPTTMSLNKCFKFPGNESGEGKESARSARKLMIQIDSEIDAAEGDEQVVREQVDSLEFSSQSQGTFNDLPCSTHSGAMISDLCSPSAPGTTISDLQKEIEMLKASCARYEAQNQELRHEIHLSTSDILMLDKAKREAVSELQSLRAQLASQQEDFQALQTFTQRLGTLLDPEDARLLSSEPVPTRCGLLLNDLELLLSKNNRMKVMYDHMVAENRRLVDVSNRFDQAEKTIEELRNALSQKEKLISVLEDQMAVLRTTASKGASSGRNSSEANKRPELTKSASSSFQKSAPSFIHKGKTKEMPASTHESIVFSSYLIEDAQDEMKEGKDELGKTETGRNDGNAEDLRLRTSSSSKDSGKRSEASERPHPIAEANIHRILEQGSRVPISSISPVPRGGRGDGRQSLRWASLNSSGKAAPKFIAKGLERKLVDTGTLNLSRASVSQNRRSLAGTKPKN